MNFLVKLTQALGLEDGASESVILAAIGKVNKPDGETVAAAAQQLVTDALKPIALAAGLPEDAEPASMITTIENLVKDNGDGNTSVITALQSELATTTKSLTALQADVSKDKATAFVDQAIKAGRAIPSTLRDHYIKRHMADALNVEIEINGMPLLGKSGTSIIPPKPTDGTTALTADQQSAATLLGISTEDYAKTLEDERA